MENNVLSINNKNDFRDWLTLNSTKEKECFIVLKRGRPDINNDLFYYLDAVEVALSFGWIDSALKRIDGVLYQRFSKRAKNSPWTELNKERARRLIKLGLMTKEGFDVLPNLDFSIYKIDEDLKNALVKENVYDTFLNFPPLYQRVRSYNVSFYKNKDNEAYVKALNHLIEMTKKNKMYGEWNDYGRLLDY